MTRHSTPADDALAFERSDDDPHPRPMPATFGDVLAARLSRRSAVKGLLATAAAGALLKEAAPATAMVMLPPVGFAEISHGVDETHHVAPGYTADVLIRWGDPVVPGAPTFDPATLTADQQSQLFGYNNDYVGFVPLPAGADGSDRGLLCVNHEFTSRQLMFRGVADMRTPLTRAQAEVEMAAHGGSIIEIARVADGAWRVVGDSSYNRRITALGTEMRLSGPAAGHDRLKTRADPEGRRVIGTFNNCAGGITPWGTYLMAEENVHGYFTGELAPDHPERRNHNRLGVPGGWFNWGDHHERFNVAKEPNEPNRFGWIVEVDPFDPQSMPVKRTALGRFKHEGAETIVNGDGRIVLYSGDDQRFEYVYRFVTRGALDRNDRAANRDLLDEGELSVARFNGDGTVDWLPLVHGNGPLTEANGFASQADVLIETRRAADLVGATPMDRPEDVQPNPVTGRVYVALTNNSKRQPDQTDAVHRRAENHWGLIVELTPPEGDHTAGRYRWDVVVDCGDPSAPETGARWNPNTSANGWFACPDNLATDAHGRLWVATDQGRAWPKISGTADGIWQLATDGAARGTGRMFFRVPVGAEMCGPCFTPDSTTLFVAVQHPGSDGTHAFKPFGRASTFDDPATRWPDFDPAMPPRPSVIAITKDDGGSIGD